MASFALAQACHDRRVQQTMWTILTSRASSRRGLPVLARCRPPCVSLLTPSGLVHWSSSTAQPPLTSSGYTSLLSGLLVLGVAPHTAPLPQPQAFNETVSLNETDTGSHDPLSTSSFVFPSQHTLSQSNPVRGVHTVLWLAYIPTLRVARTQPCDLLAKHL